MCFVLSGYDISVFQTGLPMAQEQLVKVKHRNKIQIHCEQILKRNDNAVKT